MDGHPQVVFCDLDGTLVLDNSFHVFLGVCWTLARPTARAALASRLMPRAFGRIGGGHVGLKRRVLVWVACQPQEWQDHAVAKTLARLRPTLSAPVLRILEEFRASGARIVLATAAPDLYARPLATQIGADDCLATPSRLTSTWAELLSARKARACAAWLEQHLPADGPRQIVTITDHPDDLPLLAMSDRVILQASPQVMGAITARLEADMAAAGTALPRITRIDVLSADEEAEGSGYWLWFDDRPEGPVDIWEVKMILSKHRHTRIYAGDGHWRLIRPGEPITPAVRRRDCPRPPGSRQRLGFHLRRRVMRDWLGLFH